MKKTNLFMESFRPRALGDGSTLNQVKRGTVAVALIVMAAGGAHGAWIETFDTYANGGTIIGQ